jgi:hypothetical protein
MLKIKSGTNTTTDLGSNRFLAQAAGGNETNPATTQVRNPFLPKSVVVFVSPALSNRLPTRLPAIDHQQNKDPQRADVGDEDG